MVKTKQRLMTASLVASVLVSACFLPTGVAAQQSCFIGEIRYFAGNFAPRSWALAHGQILQISNNTALFSILGVTYGGDGRTTFQLPDLRGRTAVSVGTGPGLPIVAQGQKLGVETMVLNDVAVHNHGATTSTTMRASSQDGSSSAPAGNILASPGSNDRIYRSGTAADTLLDPASTASTTTVTTEGNSSPSAFAIVQPSLVLNPIICLFGTYPSRS